MTMHKTLHHRDDVDRLFESRKEGGRGLVSIEDSVDTSMQRPEDYIKKIVEEENWLQPPEIILTTRGPTE